MIECKIVTDSLYIRRVTQSGSAVKLSQWDLVTLPVVMSDQMCFFVRNKEGNEA